MLKNYLKIAFRNLYRHKKFTLINLTGLVIAISSCIFILHYVFNELYFDGYHKNYSNIYRVRQNTGLFGYSPTTSYLLAPALMDEFPEIKFAARVGTLYQPMHIQKGINTIKENRVLFTDNQIFKVFTLPLKIGNYKHAFDRPNSVVITQKIADKYFTGNNPIGKILHVNIGSKWHDLLVTGILKDIPANSDFNVDFLISLSVMKDMYTTPGRKPDGKNSLENWNLLSCYTYIDLNNGITASNFETKFPAFIKKFIPGISPNSFMLEPLKDIHLYKIDNAGNIQPAAITDVYLFSSIAILILLIACVNFVILSTANASIRIKEIGIRKTIGANRIELIKQFLSESVIFAFITLPVALVVVELLLPYVGRLLNIDFTKTFYSLPEFILILIAIILLLGIFSGGFVAIYLSSKQPAGILVNKIISKSSKGNFRRVLIATQITIFIGLFISTLVIFNQLNYVQNGRLGFNSRQLITFNMKKNYKSFINDILQNPNVENASAGSYMPLPVTGIIFKETNSLQNPNKKIKYQAGFVDYGYFKTLGAKLLSGRTFSEQFPADRSESVVINETTAKEFGLKNPVGSIIQFSDGPKRVIGVVNDFIVSYYRTTEPFVFYLDSNSNIINTIIIRISTDNVQHTLSFIKDKFNKYSPNSIFEFHFVNAELNSQYQTAQRLGKIFGIFTGIAIFIACLGLFGLSIFVVEQRMKEFGIRKVLGASVFNLFFLQSKEFIYLSLIANIIAWPVAYYFMNKWLQDFAYKINISLWVFAVSGGIAMLIALITVSFQAVKAATMNPIKSIRYE